MASVYLIVLTGQGDVEVKVVDKETFDWVTSTNPGRREIGDARGSSWIDALVPESQKPKILKEYGREGREVRLTSGSWQNDRMISARPADGYESYDRLADALKAVKKAGDEVEDTVEGCIY